MRRGWQAYRKALLDGRGAEGLVEEEGRRALRVQLTNDIRKTERYLRIVLAGHTPPPSEMSAARRAAASMIPPLKTWAGDFLAGISWSGSFAKSTALAGNTDVDLFVSLHYRTPGTLADINSHLDSSLQAIGYVTQPRNVSIRVWPAGIATDIVVGRRQTPLSHDHSLYSRRRKTWLKTNIVEHVRCVRDSPHRDVVKLVKIWSKCHGLDWPSFYLEMATLEALSGLRVNLLSRRLLLALSAFANELTAQRVLDPANSNNVVSDDLTQKEKTAIANAARSSLQQVYWKDIVW